MLSWFEFLAETRKMAWILSRKQLKVIKKSTFISFKYLDEDVANVCFSLSVS